MKKLILFVMLMMVVGCGSDPSDSIEKNDGCFCYEGLSGSMCFYVENLDEIKCKTSELEEHGETNCNIENSERLNKCETEIRVSFKTTSDDEQIEFDCETFPGDSSRFLLQCTEI